MDVKTFGGFGISAIQLFQKADGNGRNLGMQSSIRLQHLPDILFYGFSTDGYFNPWIHKIIAKNTETGN